MRRVAVDSETRLGLALVSGSGLLVVLLWAGVSRLREAPVAQGPESSIAGALAEASAVAMPVDALATVSYREGSGVVWIEGTTLERTVPCPERTPAEARIEGDALHIRLSGTCQRVVVLGHANTVVLADASRLRALEVHGALHRLETGPLPRPFPTVRSFGEGHRFEGGLAALNPEEMPKAGPAS